MKTIKYTPTTWKDWNEIVTGNVTPYHNFIKGAHKVGYSGGTVVYYVDGLKHREDGPAVEYPKGGKEWWIHGRRHRINGPAIHQTNGEKYWYINDKSYKEQDYWIEVAKQGYDITSNPEAITALI